jgi:DNA-binding winged helix-turn-helix (wHTH) protein
MKALAQGGVFQFEGFRIDRQSRVLLRREEAGAFVPMAVGSRALDVLDVLLDRAGNLVLRDEFMAAVWPATAVEDTNLNMQIAALRRVLEEGRTEASCNQNITGRGYRCQHPHRGSPWKRAPLVARFRPGASRLCRISRRSP